MVPLVNRVGASIVAALCLAATVVLPTTIANAGPTPAPSAPTTTARQDRVNDPDRVLGVRWRASTDRAVTAVGDQNGLHVLVADGRAAYRWRNVATLSEPGLDPMPGR
jgi:hypothetical protein